MPSVEIWVPDPPQELRLRVRIYRSTHPELLAVLHAEQACGRGSSKALELLQAGLEATGGRQGLPASSRATPSGAKTPAPKVARRMAALTAAAPGASATPSRAVPQLQAGVAIATTAEERSAADDLDGGDSLVARFFE